MKLPKVLRLHMPDVCRTPPTRADAYPNDKNVCKYGAFKIKEVVYRPWLKPYRHYTLHIEKINEDAPFPTQRPPVQRNSQHASSGY